MIYNDFNGIKLSALGMGNMRLPVLDGNDSKIDVENAKKMGRRYKLSKGETTEYERPRPGRKK